MLQFRVFLSEMSLSLVTQLCDSTTLDLHRPTKAKGQSLRLSKSSPEVDLDSLSHFACLFLTCANLPGFVLIRR